MYCYRKGLSGKLLWQVTGSPQSPLCSNHGFRYDHRRSALRRTNPGSRLRSSAAIKNLLRRIARSKGRPQLDGPRFHPFPARMPVWLAQDIVESLTSTGETVLDPLVGSGSTATASLRAGRNVVGVDIDPMACMLSRVATTPYDRDAATKRLERLLDRAKKRAGRGLNVAAVRNEFDADAQEFLKYWFPPLSQKQLFALTTAAAAIPADEYRDLAWIALSSLIIAKSAGVSYALDISRSRPHKVEDKPTPKPFELWRRRLGTLVARLPFGTEDPPAAGAQIVRADARSLPINDASIELVVTSPPYLNAIDYMRTHKFSLLWMGHELSALRSIRSKMVGTERGMYSPDSLPEHLETTIVDTIDDSSRLALVRRYLSDMRRVLLEINRVLKPGGAAIVALGPSLLSREAPDAGAIIGDLAKEVGLHKVGWSFRPLQGGRRSLPPPWIIKKRNALNLRMEGEVFLGLQKP